MTEQAYIAHLVAKAKAAVAEVDAYTQAQTDRMCKVAAKTCWDHAVLLGTTAYQETGMGILPSKINKNRTAALCYEWMKGKPSVGILEDNPLTNIVTIAKPVGVVAGITPSTNPTSTAGFYATICLKCRNALILAPHPRARKSTNLVADLIRAQLREIGAPEDLVQCLGSAQHGDIQLSNDLTGLLMQASDMIIATGGAGMVKAAYSSGTPCYGVGQGNVQVLVDEGFTDYDQITSNILASRTNDAGTNCTGEQTLYVPQRQKAAQEQLLQLNLAYEAATADLNDVNMIDPFHLEAYGKTTVNYNRDVEIFPVLNAMFQRIQGASPYQSPTDMGVNMAGFAIVDDAVCQEASRMEILRRYYAGMVDRVRGKCDDDVVRKLEIIMQQAGVTPDICPAVAACLKKAEETAAPAGAMVLPDGRVVTGKNSSLLGPSAALLLNAIKALAGIDKELDLLPSSIIAPISDMKISHLGHRNPRLHSDEVLIALSISAVTNPLAERVLKKLDDLRGCDAHFSVILSEEDEKLYKRLGIHVSCQPRYEIKRLYHK